MDIAFSSNKLIYLYHSIFSTIYDSPENHILFKLGINKATNWKCMAYFNLYLMFILLLLILKLL